jgi:hypothetical protein
MRGTYCYLPILRARWGAFQAIGELSPIARSRMTPLFDVPVPTPKNGKTLETYLAERAKGFLKNGPFMSISMICRLICAHHPVLSQSPICSMSCG